MMPHVSVIIPTHNRANLLKKSVTSVLSQSYRDFELLVIDDCSTDNTSEVMANITDKRVSYKKNTSNEGIPTTRNIALSYTNGKYIAFLDDDDEWMPDKLEKQLNIMENSSTSLGCVYTGRNLIYTDDKSLNQTIVPQYRKKILKELLLDNFINTSTTLLRAACFEKVGMFDESIPFAEDYDMWIRIAQDYEFDVVMSPLINWRIHRNSIS
ncbi:MAG: glycosyltransferase family 2 protein, partial [Thermodesulfobacteriota bacterium]